MKLTPKQNRSGLWSPYVPKLDVPMGCRVGARNKLEEFNLAYLAGRIESMTEKKRQPERSALKCAFENNSMIVRYSEDAWNSQIRKCCDQPRSEIIPFSKVLDVDLKQQKVGRLHNGKITQESVEENLTAAPYRCNDRPPDNLGPALLPYVDRSVDTNFRSRVLVNRKNTSSTPNGILRVEDTIKELENQARLPSIPDSYIRVYGIGNF